MTTTELIAKVSLVAVPKGRNIDRIGWWDGYMLVKFKRGGELWVYGSKIPEHKRDQILKNPYPDSLFEKAIKAKFKAYKIGTTKNAS